MASSRRWYAGSLLEALEDRLHVWSVFRLFTQTVFNELLYFGRTLIGDHHFSAGETGVLPCHNLPQHNPKAAKAAIFKAKGTLLQLPSTGKAIIREAEKVAVFFQHNASC